MNITRHLKPHYLPALLVGLLCILVAFDAAFAQTGGSAGSFSCVDGRADGTLYESGGSCPTTISKDNIFSFLICNMEQLSSNLLGNMYCGMQEAMLPAVQAMLALAVVIFGAGFTIGVIPATAREFQKFLLKIAFVFIFATNADYMIGVGYNFLISGIREGVAIVLGGYLLPNQTSGVTGADLYAMIDDVVGTAIGYGTAYLRGTTPADACKNAVFSVLAIMAIAFPPMAYAGLLIIAKIAMTFLRAVFGYIYALVCIAFLMTLSPFFLSFYLFKATQRMFDKWLGYLASFTLQIILLFAFLTFILSIQVSHITDSFTNIIVPKQETPETTAYRFPWKYCTLCDFKAVYKSDSDPAGQWSAGDDIPPDAIGNFISEGKLVCKDTPPKSVSVDFASSPKLINTTLTDSNLDNYLMVFTVAGLLSLAVLAYIVDQLLIYLASLAQTLAGGLGGSYAPQLGGGFNPRGVASLGSPLDGAADDFGNAFHQRMIEGKAKTEFGGSTLLQATRDGVRGAIVGKDNKATGEDSIGMGRRFGRWMMNPTRSDPGNDN